MNAITFWVKLKKTPRRCERHGVLGKIEKKRRGVVNAMTFWVILGKIEK